MEQLPPGFRFYPTEEELISFYLNNKLHGHGPNLDPVIPSIDIYTFEPSQLPGLAGRLCEGEREQWFFFMPQQEREARGGRPNRTTSTGYWKATGSPTYVYSHNKVIGVKKTMVFYKGKAPTGRKTKWKMNEYKAINQEEDIVNNNTSFPSSSTTSTIPKLRHEHSLCRVYVTSGCARAFDRRPPAGTLSINTNTQINAGNNNQRQRSSSSTDDSSNSGGNDQSTLQGKEGAAGSSNSYDIDMADQALEPALWDWEQLDWL